MRFPLPSRRAAGFAAVTLLVSSLGLTAGVFVARPAAASSGTTKTTTTSTGMTALTPASGSNPAAAKYFVINGTVHAASDHEIVGSSAFPNYATGAVDNYYSMAHSHVDNSPFAQGTASPADTGPIGQTAAAGNTQQPQYADARWPGNTGKATYGTKGQPYAIAEASEYNATAESSEASSGLSGPGGSSKFATPKGFNGRLRQALAAWRTKWQGRLHLKTPTGAVKTPTVTTPTATVPTPVATVSTPAVTVAGVTVTPPVSPPPVSVPEPAVPSAAAPRTAAPSRSLTSASTSTAPADGASLLESSSLATLDPKTGALVTSGESRVGRVSLGGGQIVIEGVHVNAKITNDGSPADKVAVSVGSASIGGVPVTIDEDGVHVAGQSQNLPYQQASDALNGALKQAGIQLFLVSPEIKTGGSCDQTGTGSGTGTGTTTTTSSNDQAGTNGTNPMASSCGASPLTSSCDQTGTTSTPTTTSSALPTPPTGTTKTTTTTTTTNSSDAGTTTTTSSCDQTGTNNATSSCSTPAKTTTTSSKDHTGTATTTATTTGGLPGMTTTTSAGDGTGTTSGTPNSSEKSITATGLHVVFTQPVSQSGVPAQYIEHILGEVFLDSLAVPAGALPKLGLNLSSSSSSSCHNGLHSAGKKTSSGVSTSGGGSSAGGSSSSSSPAASTSGSSQPTSGFTSGGAQPTASSTGAAPQSFPARLASALRKPLWLLLAYVIWQALVIGTGASLRAWRREEAS